MEAFGVIKDGDVIEDHGDGGGAGGGYGSVETLGFEDGSELSETANRLVQFFA